MPSLLNSHQGYLEIDHSQSPGIPEHLAGEWKARGLIVAGPGETLKRDTWLCPHCNAIVVKNPDRTRPREVCRRCMKVVCDKCVLWCTPFEGIIEGVASGRLAMLGNGLIVPKKELSKITS